MQPVLVPVETSDRVRENHHLVWRAELGAAQRADGVALLEDPACLRIERFLIDALCAWPDSPSTGLRPGSIELIGGRVNGRIESGRWRRFHSMLSSDTRPRWPLEGFPDPPPAAWELVRPPGGEQLPAVPDLAKLSPREHRAWLDERLRSVPRLVNGGQALFPVCREFSNGLRWVYCDEDLVFDRLWSSYKGLQPSRDWRWSCSERSLAGTRTADGARVEWTRETFPRMSSHDMAIGVAESVYLPTWLSQRLADMLSDASYALEDMTLSVTDIRSGDRSDLALVSPRRLSHRLTITGGILPVSIEEGLSASERPSDAPKPPPVGSKPPRFRWDEERTEIRDVASGRSLSFVETLKGDAWATQDQWFALRYRDDSLEWPIFVRRRSRIDGYRPKPWFADLRPVEGGQVPDELTFTAMRNFVAAALNGWPDSELTGPAPPSAVLLGGYLNGRWRNDYSVLVSGADPTKLPIDGEWVDPDLTVPRTRWTVRTGKTEAPPPAPETGSVRPAGYLAEWFAANPHGPVLSADDGSGLLVAVGSVTTTGHGGDTTIHWDFEDRALWLRLTSNRWGWNPVAAGPIRGADPAVFEHLVRPRTATRSIFLAPQLQVQLDRARLALAEAYGTAELTWLAIDGAMIPVRTEHFVNRYRPSAIWHAAGDDWSARVWPLAAV